MNRVAPCAPGSRSARAAFVLVALSTILALPAGEPAVAQPPAAPATPTLPPPRETAEFYLKLLAARPVDVESLRRAPAAELPFARVRLSVAATVSGTTWPGLDYHLFRDAGRVARLELALPNPAFGDTLAKTLRACSSCSRRPLEADTRVVDVWCQNTGKQGEYQALFVKVWDDDATVRSDDDANTKVKGRICHADLPQLDECQRTLDYSPIIFRRGMHEVSFTQESGELLALAIARRREDLDALEKSAQQGVVKATEVTGGTRIDVTGLRGLTADACVLEGCEPRSQGERSCIVLSPGSQSGTVTFPLTSTFPFSAAAISASAETFDSGSSVELEASTGAGDWKRLFRIADNPEKLADRWVFAAPEGGHDKLIVRARMAASDGGTAGTPPAGTPPAGTPPAGTPPGSGPPAPVTVAGGPRLFDHRLAVPSRYEVLSNEGVLRVVEREEPVNTATRPLRILLQPGRIDSKTLVTLVREDQRGTVDVYAPCDLDESSCRAVADYGGTVRFWARAPWQAGPPPTAATLVSGSGTIGLQRVSELTPGLATILGGGMKSLSFPAVERCEPESLAAVAACSGKLALDGLAEITAAHSTALARYAGPGLSLGGLRQARFEGLPSEALLTAAVAAPGTCTLAGVTEIDARTAALLADGRKHLLLDDLRSLPPDVAGALATAQTGLSLDGVESLDGAAVGKLIAFKGPFLSLGGLRRIDLSIDALIASALDAGKRPDLASLLAPRPGPDAEARARRAALIEELGWLRQATGGKPETAPAAEGGPVDAEPDEAAMRDEIDRLRRTQAGTKRSCRIWLGPGGGSPVDALLRAEGIVSLKSSAPGGAAGVALDVVTARSLAAGRKHLLLDQMPAPAPEALTALVAAPVMMSLAGIQTLSEEALKAFADYRGPHLFLEGVETVSADQVKVLAPLVESDRISLPRAGILNVAELRRHAKLLDLAQHGLSQKAMDSFMTLSGPRDWSGQGKLQKGRGTVVAILADEVVFRDEGRDARRPRSWLSKSSNGAITTLSKAATEVAAARKAALFAAAAAGQPLPFAPPPKEPAKQPAQAVPAGTVPPPAGPVPPGSPPGPGGS